MILLILVPGNHINFLLRPSLAPKVAFGCRPLGLCKHTCHRCCSFLEIVWNDWLDCVVCLSTESQTPPQRLLINYIIILSLLNRRWNRPWRFIRNRRKWRRGTRPSSAYHSKQWYSIFERQASEASKRYSLTFFA